jgi:biotin carboxylase
MAHILVFDIPGGNDFTIIEDACTIGHDVTFVTSDLSHYHAQGEGAANTLARCAHIVEIKPYTYEYLEKQLAALHELSPIHAVICLIDIRLIDAARIAQRFGLPFMSPDTAILLRDKSRVRQKLRDSGVRQPLFAIAHTLTEMERAIAEIGLPVVIKPVDGYGSQDITIVKSLEDFKAFTDQYKQNAAQPRDYGLGVTARHEFFIERYMQGHLIGCDVFSDGRERTLIGINEKLMYPLPSFAIRGGHFPSHSFDQDIIKEYAFSILDHVGFHIGAAHIEMMVCDNLPYLVEINARLVSAQIPFQMAYALNRSLYIDLIDLHLGVPLSSFGPFAATQVCAIRWITADRKGHMKALHLPDEIDPAIRRVTIFKRDGDEVQPPLSNGDRIAYVMAAAPTAKEASDIAEHYIAMSSVEIL